MRHALILSAALALLSSLSACGPDSAIDNDFADFADSVDLGDCIAGELGCWCTPGDECLSGYVCAVAENGASVCSLPADTAPSCEHGLDMDLDGFPYDGACVARCVQNVDDCGAMACSPKDVWSDGFCAHP